MNDVSHQRFGSCPFSMSSQATTSTIIMQINILFDSSLSNGCIGIPVMIPMLVPELSFARKIPDSEYEFRQCHDPNPKEAARPQTRTFHMLQTQCANTSGISMKQNIFPAHSRSVTNENTSASVSRPAKEQQFVASRSRRARHHVFENTKNQNRSSQCQLLHATVRVFAMIANPCLTVRYLAVIGTHRRYDTWKKGRPTGQEVTK